MKPNCDDDKYLAEGTHINAIGSYQLTKREITSETVQRATLFVDSRKATLKEAGELIIPLYERIDLSVTEIGEVLLDKDQGRKSREEITLFKSVGNAAQDLICAIHIFDKINK